MLSIIASLYAKIAGLRNALYEKGVFEVHDLKARTISIGNITAGGTGKTPLVAYVAGVLADRGEKVCVLTRGYGRQDAGRRVVVSDWENVLASPETAGDEPFEIAHDLLGRAVVVADADRVAAAEMAGRDLEATAIVLDDGFQHRKVKRDLDIVCIDATAPFGGREMLPAGRLREPLDNLARADVVVITRADLTNDLDELQQEIHALAPDAKIFKAIYKITRVTELNGFRAGPRQRRAAFPDSELWARVKTALDVEPAAKMSLGAFCALGNPNAFFDQMRAIGLAANFDLTFTRAFRDHHVYAQSDIDALAAEANQAGVHALLTTAKDAVKLGGLDLKLPCFVVQIEMVIDRPDEFDRML